MRRRDSAESSLDLLLDTICNMFGMVIFIAVLAAVLVGARGEQRVEEAHASAAYTADVIALREQVDLLVPRENESLSQQVLASKDDVATAQLLGQRLLTAVNSAKRLLVVSDAATEIGLLQSKIKSMEEELKSIKDLRDINVRTPRQRALRGRVPVQVVLTDDRFHLINDWSDWRRMSDPTGQRCRFWQTWNTQAVVPELSSFDDNGTCEYRTGNLQIDRSIQLRPGGGLSPNTATGQAAITELMKHLVPGKHVVSFRVTPDSFDSFHAARRLAVERGLEYDVKPISPLGPGELYRDRIRQGMTTGQ